MAKLILFDINGTLIERDQRTDQAFNWAIDECLGLKNSMSGVDNLARSDRDVFLEVIRNHHIAYNDQLWQDFLVNYEQQLNVCLSSDIWRVNADAQPFVKRASQVADLALITGELSIGARYKLTKIGLWQYFPVGGFGEDGLKRFDIASTAYKKATMHYQRSYDDVFVIGDTVLDIKTARHIGAKVISIATGGATYQELQAHQPDYLIRSYAELPQF